MRCGKLKNAHVMVVRALRNTLQFSSPQECERAMSVGHRSIGSLNYALLLSATTSIVMVIVQGSVPSDA